MIKKIKKFFKAINDWGDYTQQKFDESLYQLATVKQLLTVLVPFSLGWLFTWNAHIVFPWIESFFNIGPYDPDTPGTILLRRSWSTAVCAPVIIYAVIRFSINRYRMRKDAEKKNQSIDSN